MFHAKFDLNNYKYCDVGLQIKCTHGIAPHISRNLYNLGLRTIVQDGAFQYLPLSMCVVMRTSLDLKQHVMDSPLVKANEALGSPFLKSMPSHPTLVNRRPMNLVIPFLLFPQEMVHQLLFFKIKRSWESQKIGSTI